MLGPEPEPVTLDNAVAIHAWNLLANGMGGIDWAGLPLVAEVLGIADVESLLDAFLTIKTHRPDRDDGPEPPPDEAPSLE